jgi:DNA-binding GntR family transcriptional regulator
VSEVEQPLVEQLAETLRARVLSGEIPSGTRLRQEAIAREFGVSRTPVREALRQLQAMGVAQLEHNRGAVVRGPTARELREAYEVRAELEGLAAELAATRIGDEQLGRLREAQQLFRRSIETLISRRRRGSGREPRWADDSDWVRANDLFHQVIQEAAGNGQLLRTIGDLHRSFPRALTWSALSGSSALLEENIRQHNAILEAIEGRDPQEARRRMAEHIRAAGELIAHRFEQSRDGV